VTAVFRRLAAIGEIMAMLIAGVLALRLLLPLLPAAWTSGVWENPADSALPLALSDSLTIALRFSVLIVLSFTWLWLRFRVTPAQAGVGTGGKSIARLALIGVITGGIAALPWKAIVLWNMHTGFGEGLHGFDQVMAAGFRYDVILLVLGTAVLLPPLFEEVLARGYMCTRVALGFGPVCGVLIVALVFALSHGHFHSDDPVVRMLAASSLFAAIVFGWVTLRTGSVLPAIIGHAALNAPEPSDPIGMSVLVAVFAVIAALSLPILLKETAAFFAAVSRERWLHLLWALPLVGAIFIFGFQYRELLLGIAALGAVLAVLDAIFFRAAPKT
jgi:membrane protease YdiL (CAAX protease family)